MKTNTVFARPSWRFVSWCHLSYLAQKLYRFVSGLSELKLISTMNIVVFKIFSPPYLAIPTIGVFFRARGEGAGNAIVKKAPGAGIRTSLGFKLVNA